jgi:hypothetical protein
MFKKLEFTVQESSIWLFICKAEVLLKIDFSIGISINSHKIVVKAFALLKKFYKSASRFDAFFCSIVTSLSKYSNG